MNRRFILNAQARPGNDLRFIPPEECDTPQSRAETITLARGAMKKGLDQLVVLGGDGTLNAVVNGVMTAERRETPLLVTHWGTGKDYAKALYGNNSWREILNDFDVRKVDVGKVELEKGETHYFINAATIGLSAQALQLRPHLPHFVPAVFTYALPAVLALFQARSSQMKCSLDGHTIEGEYLNLFCLKGKTIGGGIPLGGNVSLDDGMLDITLVRAVSLIESFSLFLRVLQGNLSHPKLVKTKAKQIVMESAHPMPVETDGEVIGQTNLRVSVLPQALRICVPKQS